MELQHRSITDISTEESSHPSVPQSTNTNTDAADTDTCDRYVKVEPDDDIHIEAEIIEEDVDIHQYARFYPQDVMISLQQPESATKGHATFTVQDISSAARPASDGPSPNSSQTAVYTLHPDITETEGSPLEESKAKTCGDNDLYTQLDTHNPTDTKKSRFQCHQCPASFTWNWQLKTHVMAHTGEKPFKCQQCPASFTRRSALTRHMLTHTGERPFKCQWCPKSFIHSSNLKKHLLTHTREKPFKCKQCPASFTRSTTLKQHLVRHSGEKPFKCQEFPASFARSTTPDRKSVV